MLLGLLAGSAGLALAACGGAAAPASSAAAAKPSGTAAASPSAAAKPAGGAAPEIATTWDGLVAAAKKEGKVVVNGPPDPKVRDQLPAAFKKAFGIDMEFL